MKLKNTGGQAFPSQSQPYTIKVGGGGVDNGGGGSVYSGGGGGIAMGLTKREYFAADAMKGILAGAEVSVEFAAFTLGIPVEAYNPLIHWQQYISKRAVQQADALLAELENTAYEAPETEMPVATEGARPTNPVEGQYKQDSITGEVSQFTNGEWQPIESVTAKGGEGGTADKPAGRGEIYVGGVLYSPDHPDYDEKLKEIVCNFPGSCK